MKSQTILEIPVYNVMEGKGLGMYRHTGLDIKQPNSPICEYGALVQMLDKVTSYKNAAVYELVKQSCCFIKSLMIHYNEPIRPGGVSETNPSWWCA